MHSPQPSHLSATRVLLVGLLAALAGTAAPRIGYAYPAGGARGTTVLVEVGGQSLRGTDVVRLSGTGIRGEIIEYVPAMDNQDLRDTERFLRDLVTRRWCLRVMDEVAKKTDEPPLPDHPWLRNLDKRGPYELKQLRQRLFDPKIQPNAQLAEKVALRLTIAADASPGVRELRLISPTGLSNPIRFQVGSLPEARERDFAGGAAARAVIPPLVLNGQIMPGETDRIRIQAKQGQKLLVQVQARRLIPYLADAVPGWFQAVASLHAPDGRELAWCDDHRFDPDPAFVSEIPADGVYELRVRDAIYRGREDFVYRIAVGELPLATQVFPLGARKGQPATVTVQGWNLPPTRLSLDTTPGMPCVRQLAPADKATSRQAVKYMVDALPDTLEAEPNNDAGHPQDIPFPCAVNGRIENSQDADVFRFVGKAGQEVVAEVWARRLDSPLDSFLRLLAEDGTVIAANDDTKDREMGLLTHHADSRLQAKLPRDGRYLLQLTDIQRQGSAAHAYRLQVRSPEPDFALRAVPSAVGVSGGRSTPFAVHILRKEGFAGEVSIVLVDPPEGFTLSNAKIPADKDKCDIRLGIPRGLPRGVVSLRLAGRATIGGNQVERPAVPAEDMMQAFLWRFLVPQQEFLVTIDGPRPVPVVWRPLVAGVTMDAPTPVRVPLGGTVQVHVRAPRILPDNGQTPLGSIRFSLANHPRGIRLADSSPTADGVALTFEADRNMALPGDKADMVVEASLDPPGDADACVSLGVLPSIPFEIVKD